MSIWYDKYGKGVQTKIERLTSICMTVSEDVLANLEFGHMAVFILKCLKLDFTSFSGSSATGINY